MKVYEQTKFCRHISIDGRDITTSVFEKQTSAILQIYFRFRFRPFARNLHIILHQATKFRPNRSSHCANITSYPFLKMAAATAEYYFKFRICWYLLPSEVQSLWANKISSTYLNWWLKYYHFRFWKTNVCHMGNLPWFQTFKRHLSFKSLTSW